MKTLKNLIFILNKVMRLIMKMITSRLLRLFCYKNQVKNQVFFERIAYFIFTLFSNKTMRLSCYKNQVKNKVFFENNLILTLFSNKTTSVGPSAYNIIT
jgi:hypothetical protein